MKTTSMLDGLGALKADAGKHLSFEINGRGYAIPFLTVNEIIEIMDVAPKPRAPAL